MFTDVFPYSFLSGTEINKVGTHICRTVNKYPLINKCTSSIDKRYSIHT